MRDIPWKLENLHKIVEEELVTLEERFGFRMPEDLRQFYLQHNGGIFPSAMTRQVTPTTFEWMKPDMERFTISSVNFWTTFWLTRRKPG